MTTLADIARDMLHQATRTGAAQRDLPGGLRVQYVRIAGESTLILTRPAATPEDDEISLMRGYFNVPIAARRLDRPHGVEFRW